MQGWEERRFRGSREFAQPPLWPRSRQPLEAREILHRRSVPRDRDRALRFPG